MMESSLPVDDLELENPPRKKVKILGQDDISTEATVNSVTAVENSNNISITPSLDITNDSIAGNMDGKPKIQTLIAIAENEQMQKELAVGIEVFVSDDPGFQGIMKRR